nr:MAG TPA: hypothetical protein [Caudoviricetes sp.]
MDCGLLFVPICNGVDLPPFRNYRKWRNFL